MSALTDGSRLREVASFAVVGLIAYFIDVLAFNALLLGTDTGSAPAKVLSSLLAIGVAFAGSRWFTWRHRRSSQPVREYLLFLTVSLVAAGVQLICLLVSREMLDLRSPLADNVSANVVGMALATLLRFCAFRSVVFPERAESGR